MEALRSYILSVSAAAIFCGMVTALAGKSGTASSVLKLMTGVVMAVVIIRPITEVSAVNLGRYLDVLNADAAAAVEAGTAYAKSETSLRIKQQLEAYILDKAGDLSLDISADVALDEQAMVPAAVVIRGEASPYARSVLETLLREELGIPEEGITWK